ncbi:hypothetical protein BJF81_07335 [Ornithinimicrobium sp. CNJ-824]|nr:hypothetical protein BJF81_07335 [Ornithinimicrobium sp. CNJ-824]
MPGQVAVEPQDHDLAGAGVPTHPDLAVEPPAPAGVAADEHDDPGRVLPGRVVGRADRVVGAVLVDADDEGQHPAHRHGAHPVAQAQQLLDHLAGGRAGQVADHGSLQVRPSRAISSWAESGPHVPAA